MFAAIQFGKLSSRSITCLDDSITMKGQHFPQIIENTLPHNFEDWWRAFVQITAGDLTGTDISVRNHDRCGARL
jgi:hypothetical protein